MAAFRSLSPQEFDQEFGALHRSIFSDEGFDVRPFHSRKWGIVLVPYGSNMEEQDLRCLAQAAETCGDQEMVIKDSETRQPSEAAVVIQASPAAFEAVKTRPGTNLAIMDTHMFGRSGRWGCILAASLDDIAILGGDSEFIARFVETVGGVTVLRDRFLKFSTTEWSIGEEARSRLLGLASW